jgi:hydrogenase expression/formation protein HypC
MCLSVPAKIIQIDQQMAEVDVLGNRHTASLALIDDAKVGDYVLVHAGFAITKMSPEDAAETLSLWQAISDVEAQEGG